MALARAFIKKPKLMLFDEATSALDKRNEAQVQAAMDKMAIEQKGITSIVIAHRLTTIRHADKIIVMKKGKVVEQGSHNELLENHPKGVYAKLVKIQKKSE
jgi:ABC-type multidrug transport system fused ATPase/permease subunit